MTDRPILFNAPMVRASLNGRKTQTRRVISPGSVYDDIPGDGADDFLSRGWAVFYRGDMLCAAKPRFSVGDRLWVRESWWIAYRYSYGTTPGGCELSPSPLAWRRRDPVFYAADGNPPNCANRHYGPDGLRGGRFAAPDPYATWVRKPSIHMPRWASRLTLIVTDVRVQRLQDISENDAIAEGCIVGKATGRVFQDIAGLRLFGPYWSSARDWFADLWDEINGPGSWDANPWVVAYTFTVHDQNIDALVAA